jgi:hypothetical protein
LSSLRKQGSMNIEIMLDSHFRGNDKYVIIRKVDKWQRPKPG